MGAAARRLHGVAPLDGRGVIVIYMQMRMSCKNTGYDRQMTRMPVLLRALRRRNLLVLGALVLITAVAAGPRAAMAKPLDVVATTGMIGDLIAVIAGPRANVKVLMGPGVDPHSYRQTRSDVVALGEADAVFYNGLYLEAQLEDLLVRLKGSKPVFALAESLPSDLLRESEDYPGRFDPHVWMVPALWTRVAVTARDALSQIDPDGAALYQQNAAAYIAELEALEIYQRERLASVPEGRRVLLSAHDAFGYFGREYGFEVIGVQGISTESEAGLARIAALVETIVERGLGAVFVESSVADRNIRAVIEGARARGADVALGGELFSDAMGAPGTYEGTYLGMIDHNATTITRALGGDAPRRGRLGTLSAGS
jgi:manganese/zinc/iron transport system substrate-binding protein